MREVLFLAHRIPFPPNRGDKIRSFNIVKRLAGMARVHVAAFADDAADAAHEAGLRAELGDKRASCFIPVRRRSKPASFLAGLASGRPASMAAFASRAMHAHVRAILARRSVASIFAFSGQMGQYVPDKLGGKRFVMDFVDVDSAKFASYADDAAFPLNHLYRREAALLAREEAGIAARAHRSLFVTEAEAELFRARAPGCTSRVSALENGVDLVYFDPAAAIPSLSQANTGPLFVFSGQMDYAPNVQAVTHFACDVLPRVRAGAPAAAFAIVGRDPAPEVRKLAGMPGVEVVGAVPDMRPWLAAADVVVAPLRIARGVQNKVLEAMAMGRPVVASGPAFEGIDAAAGRDLLVADGPQATAGAALSLIGDAELAAKVGRAARARMQARYAWDRQLAALPELLFG